MIHRRPLYANLLAPSRGCPVGKPQAASWISATKATLLSSDRSASGAGLMDTSRLLDSRASVAVFDGRAPRRERAEKLVWAARFPRASYPTVCGQKFRARRRSRRQKSSFSARLLRQPLTVERRSHAMGRPPQHGRALPDHALGRSLCYWRRFWSRERHRRERADVLEPPKNGFLARRPQSSCSARWSETRWT